MNHVQIKQSPERQLLNPPGFILENICKEHNRHPASCLYIDSRDRHRKSAHALGMQIASFERLKNADYSAHAVEKCRTQLLDRKIIFDPVNRFSIQFNCL